MLKVPVLQAEPPDAAHGGDDALHDVSFECYNLPNMDTLSKTDAMVVAFAQEVRPSSAAKGAGRPKSFLAGLAETAGKQNIAVKSILAVHSLPYKHRQSALDSRRSLHTTLER